jgi:UDP-2,3-diacylglucosamine pyrophosphatase LpxH
VPFISDLHLSRSQASGDSSASWRASARRRGPLCPRRSLRGWIGDDDVTEQFNSVIVSSFAALVKRGTPLYLCGNAIPARQALLRDRRKLLKDPTVLDLDGTPTLLMLATRSAPTTSTQRWRRKARNRLLQALFLTTPLERRRG